MKSTLFKNLALMLFASGCLLGTQSCDTSSDDDNNPKDSTRATGWKGSDDPEKIPQNVSLPNFDGSGAGLPDKVDLTPKFPPIGDQGQYGTCVAWATAYNCKTALEAIKYDLSPSQLSSAAYQMSPKYLFTALPNDKKGENCNGTDFVPALDVMLDKGVASQATVPYTSLGNCTQSGLDASWNTDAAKHKIKYYRRIPDQINDIKQALAAKIPVILGAKLDDSFMGWNSDAVYQSHTSFTNVGIHSYHAMCIVGYDNSKGPRGAFRVANSWSNQWGSGGYIWVDYNFMLNGFAFNKNFFVAVNDDQKPDPTDPNPPVASGVDLAPWIDLDYSDPQTSATDRKMEFNIYNIGTQPALASDNWGYAYLYYNAYNANDYGVVFYDDFKNQGAYRSYTQNTYPADPPSPEYYGLTINCNIPADDDLAHEFFNDVGLVRTYTMPNTLTGYYYLVLIVDVTNKFTESDESNNLFYTTEQDPKYFSNGYGERRNVANDAFKNLLTKGQMKSKDALRYRSAVKPTNRNAYTPEEIIGLLKKEAKSGRLAKQIAAAKQVGKANGTLMAKKNVH
ncbi:MAG TPA: C1 family peptidase [Catalimonadaceae bacterium]|jgi:C1A family cysteine protease|nr:C1 family peptidase [Catalimonadaceae bacterium]